MLFAVVGEPSISKRRDPNSVLMVTEGVASAASSQSICPHNRFFMIVVANNKTILCGVVFLIVFLR
jgi:hypothetical protein